MPRNDPTDNGGLFIGRRPGTGPTYWRKLARHDGGWRAMLDRFLAVVLLLVMALTVISFWGPVPVAGLWVGSQVQYLSDSPAAGILVAFIFCVACYLGGLKMLHKLDRAWILVRRSSGVEQTVGILPRLITVSSIVGLAGFVFWLLFFSGASLAPVGISL